MNAIGHLMMPKGIEALTLLEVARYAKKGDEILMEQILQIEGSSPYLYYIYGLWIAEE